jgi:hypothetical protein
MNLLDQRMRTGLLNDLDRKAMLPVSSNEFLTEQAKTPRNTVEHNEVIEGAKVLEIKNMDEESVLT